MSDHGRAHAVLSPSSADRWLTCPGSIQLVESLGRGDDGGSEYAEEGTRCHTLAEIEAAYAFGLTNKEQYDTFRAAWLQTALAHGDDIEEMERHVQTYVSLLQDIAADLEGPVTVRLELRVQTGVPDCWGTADAALITPRKIVAVDYKYGQGVLVLAEQNPQLMLYSVGVLEALDVLGTVEDVDMWICQPRAGGSSRFSMSAVDLLAWRDGTVMAAARETRALDPRLVPSEKGCRWCPAAGACAVRAKHVAHRDFGHPDLLTEDELADAVRRLAEIRSWCNDVEAEALSQAYSEGKHLPGLKVVLSGGRRAITDQEAAIARLMSEGYTETQVSRKTARPLGELERLVGKQRLPEVLGDLLQKSEGKPSLVSEDDDRPAINSLTAASNDFQSE
jgi:hypothetical protein